MDRRCDNSDRLRPKAELKVLKKLYEREGQYVSLQTRFNCAWCLIKRESVAD
jgi:hypothetical protein